MLNISEAQRRTELFLTGQMLEALRAVEYELPSFPHRLVVVYRVPALDALDSSTLAVRLERWRIGAEHAGWKFGSSASASQRDDDAE